MSAKFFILILVTATLLPGVIYAQDNAMARKLINSQGCKACHALAGDGGTLSVSFETMRQNLSQDEIRAKLVNPERQHGNAKISDFSHLDNEEIDVLVEFIQPQP